MKLRICDGVFEKQSNEQLEVYNRFGESIKLLGVSKEIYLLLKEKQDTITVETYFNNNEKVSTKYFRTLLYALINLKIFEIVCEFVINNKKINIKSAVIEITDACNFRCPHCYVEKTGHNQISKEDLFSILDELNALNCHKVCFTGGEVLTRPDFKEIYTYAFNKDFAIGINTNGSLLDENFVNFFIDKPPCNLEISLYGFDDDSYKTFTKCEINFNEMLKNIKMLKEHGINILFKDVVNNSNFEIYDKIKSVAIRNSIPFKADFLIFPKVGEPNTFNPEQLSVPNCATFLDGQKDSSQYFMKLFSSKPKSKENLFLCKQNDDSIFVSATKKVSVCTCMQSLSEEYKKGNLLKCILNLQNIKEKKMPENQKCKNCELISICKYCPGKFFMSTNSYSNPPSWFCDFGQMIYDKYIKGVKILPQIDFCKDSFKKLFEIIKQNMSNLGQKVEDKDFELWYNSIVNQALDKNLFMFNMFFDGNLVGFVTLNTIDNKLYLSELQLSESAKRTKILFYLIDNLLKLDYLRNFNEIYFNINNKNFASINAFTSLGATVVKEKEKSKLYKLNRESCEKLIQKRKAHNL